MNDHCSRKRKLTDKTLPSSITQSTEFPDSQFYQELLQMEKKLDWTMMRKKVELQDALGRPMHVSIDVFYLFFQSYGMNGFFI